MSAWRKASACGASNTCVEVAEWRTATPCSNEGNCVEVGAAPGAVAVRDSADPDGQVLALTRAAFGGLLGAIKGGDLTAHRTALEDL